MQDDEARERVEAERIPTKPYRLEVQDSDGETQEYIFRAINCYQAAQQAWFIAGQYGHVPEAAVTLTIAELCE